MLNNLTIDGTNAPTLTCNNYNLTVGGNFTVSNGATFFPFAVGGLTGTLTQASENYANVNDGTYGNISPSSTTGSGTGALFTIVITGNNVTSITVKNSGSGYLAGDQITLEGELDQQFTI